MISIQVKILGTRREQRYCVRWSVLAAETVLKRQFSDLQIELTEEKTVNEILKYTPVLASVVLMVNGKMVSVGRIPSRQDVIDLLLPVLEQPGGVQAQ